MKELLIIKIGGNVIDDHKALQTFVKDVANTKISKIIVHGGGKLATELSSQLGIETKMHEGRRITNAETLKVTTMVYAGWLNKSIVALLNARGNGSIGLCGADAFLIPATKRKNKKVDFGFVGDVKESSINTKLLKGILKMGITPVIAPITSDKNGQLLNTNADTIASSLASALSKNYNVRLIYCFEKKGVMYQDKVIRSINSKIYDQLKEKHIVKDGMIPKLDNAFDALKKGVKQVVIGQSKQLNKLIYSNGGTVISK